MEQCGADNGFGTGQGELLALTCLRPLPMRLDRWLVAQRPEQSRARIQKFIDAGYVRVNGSTGCAKTPLRQNDRVELWMPPPEPLPCLVAQDIPLDVLYEDSHLIVLNKPAGLTVHPAPGNRDGTLVNALLHRRDQGGLRARARQATLLPLRVTPGPAAPPPGPRPVLAWP